MPFKKNSKTIQPIPEKEELTVNTKTDNELVKKKDKKIIEQTNNNDANDDVVNDADNANADDANDINDAVDTDDDAINIEDKNISDSLNKKKESFEEVTKKIQNLRSSIKITDKEINEIQKEIKIKEKVKNDLEKQLNLILKGLDKIHCDAVNKARKEKKKRKGNVNGGFNKECEVPEILRNFLDLPNDVLMARPKVMSAINNKFTELKLKEGQNTTLNAFVVEKLKLGEEYKGKIIKFTEFQGFLATFYPKKEKI